MEVMQQQAYRFGAAPLEPWRRRRVGLSGQELIPAIDYAESFKFHEFSLHVIDMGRAGVFHRYEEMIRAVIDYRRK